MGTIALAMTCATMNAQVTVGAGTLPKATLDVVTSSLDAEIPEGVIAPRLTGDQIQTKDNAYGSDQTGAIVYATAKVTTASPKTANITAAGYYYFDGNVWQTIQGGTEWYAAGTANDAQSAKTGAITRNGHVAVYYGQSPTTAAASPIRPFDIINDGGGDGEDDMAITTYSGTTSSTPAMFLFRSNGTLATPEPLKKGDQIGSFKFGGRINNTTTTQTAGIMAKYWGDGTTNKSDLSFVNNGNSTRMLIDTLGQVGINTTAPVAKLDIKADVAGKGFKMVDGSQAAGKVLTTVDGSGAATWALPALKMIEENEYNPTYAIDSIPFVAGTARVTGHSITIPPGKWKVELNAVMSHQVAKPSATPIPQGDWAWIYWQLTDDPTAAAPVNTADVAANKQYVSMVYTGLKPTATRNIVQYAVSNGFWTVNNTSGADKTYYVFVRIGATNEDLPNSYLYNLLGTQYENKLVATPVL
jgi:hypothetical protein